MELQTKLDERYYTATLAFVHDLCDAVNTVINTEPKPTNQPQLKLESVVAPVKHDFSDIRDRKRLGKRILKSVQSQLESALRIEADATNKTFDTLRTELENLLECSLEVRPSKQTSSTQQTEIGVSQDVIMVDSSAAEITVGGETSDDGATTDVAMIDAEGDLEDEDRNIEVATSADGTVEHHVTAKGKKSVVDNKLDSSDLEPADTPPATNGYVTAPASVQPGPPTPPQSNGSFGRQATESLAEGGIPWYLQDFEPVGTTAVPEQPRPERVAARSPSEALSEMDDDELTGLGAEINEGSITASPAVDNKSAKHVDEDGQDDEEDNAAAATTPSAKSTSSPIKKSAAKSRKRKVTYRRR